MLTPAQATQEPAPVTPEAVLASARRVISQEAESLTHLSDQLDNSFVAAVNLIRVMHGRVIVVGIGKSGIVGRKIAASLASLGTPAFFVHAAEAMHGDLGMITGDDVLIVISHSGATPEITNFLHSLQPTICPIIAITGSPDSPLARWATVHLNTGVTQEADSRGLAPTTSATATMVIGDALALTLADLKGFTRDMFGRFHPGGDLGRQVIDHYRSDTANDDAQQFSYFSQ